MATIATSQLTHMERALGISDLRVTEDQSYTLPRFFMFQWKKDGHRQAVKIPTVTKTVVPRVSLLERLIGVGAKPYQTVDWILTADRFASVVRSAALHPAKGEQ